MRKIFALGLALFLLTGCQMPFGFFETMKLTPGDAKLIFVSPTDQSTDVTGKTPVTFLWDKPIFPLENPEKTQRFLKKNIKISPAIDGAWQVLGTTGILFEPAESWNPCTRYEFSMAELKIKYAFETPRLEIISVDSSDLILKEPLVVHFNQDIDLAEARKMWVTPAQTFTIKYHTEKEKDKNGKDVTREIRSAVDLVPQKDWPADTGFVLGLPKDTHGSKGSLPKKEEQTMEFHTILPFSATFDGPQNALSGIGITFSTEVSVAQALEKIKINPTDSEAWKKYVEKKNEDFGKDAKTSYLWLDPIGGNWDPTQKYTVTLDASLADKWNRVLGTEQKKEFQVKFPAMVRSIFAPQEMKVFRTGTVPKFSVWYTGEHRNVFATLEKILPEKVSETKKLTWPASFEKRTVAEFDPAKDFSSLLKEKILPAGWYRFALVWTPISSEEMGKNFKQQPETISFEFAVTDFPVEIKTFANSQSEIYPHGFPGDAEITGPFDADLFDLSWETQPAQWKFKSAVSSPDSPIKVIDPFQLVLVQSGGRLGIGNSNFSSGIQPYDSPVNFSPWEYSQEMVGVAFPDRPLFRPGDTMFFKSIFRERDLYEKAFPLRNTDPEKSISYRVKIMNPSWEEVSSESFTAKGGSLDGQWKIPADAPLGQYQVTIEFLNDDQSPLFTAFTEFYVTEYRKPKFLVDASFSAPHAVWKEKVVAKISAEYAFGGGLAGKKVFYTASLFGTKKHFWYWENEMRSDKMLTHGEAKLDQNGKLEIPIPLDMELDKDVNWALLNLDLTVESSADEMSSKTISVPFFLANEKIEITPTKYFFENGDTEVSATGKITSLDDKPVEKSLTAELFQTKWARSDRRGGDGEFVGEWQNVEELVTSQKISSDPDGKFEAKFETPKTAGEYFIRVSAQDVKSRTASSEAHFWVWSEAQSEWSMRQNDVNKILPLFSDKETYAIGDSVEVLFPHNEWKIDRAHITIERGNVLETLTPNLEKNTASFKVESWMAPDVFVSVLIEGRDSKGSPRVRWGSIKIPVTDPSRKLDVTLTPERKFYKPGEKIKLKVATAVQGKPIAGEVTVSVVDATLLALMARPELSIWQRFLAELPLGVQTTSTLANFMSDIDLSEIYAQVEKIKAAAESPFGGGGAEAEKGGAMKPRGDFQDTAAFIAKVQTDESGNAEVEIPLPDNLTTWDIWAVGATNGNAFGEAETSVQTALPVMALPIMPNVLRAGDSAQVGVLIRRSGENLKSEKTTVTFTPDAIVTTKDEKEKTVSMDSEARVFFDVSVPKLGKDIPLEGKEVAFTFSVKTNSGDNDAVTVKTKILPPLLQTTAAEFLDVSDATKMQIKTDERSLRSILKVKIFGTLLDRLTKLVNLGEESNFLCTEQRLSAWTLKLMQKDLWDSIGKSIEPIDAEKLKKERDAIVAAQDFGGGFKFWPETYEPNEWLTAQVLEFAPVWAKHGAEFPKEKLEQSRRWLRDQVLTPCTENTRCLDDVTRQESAFVLFQTQSLEKESLEFLAPLADSLEAKVWFLRSVSPFDEKSLAPSVREKKAAYIEEVKRAARARDRIIFWEEAPEMQSFFSQPERLTSLVFEWMLDNELVPSQEADIARYLSETKSGLSGNTALRVFSALEKYSKTRNTKENFPAEFLATLDTKNLTTGTLKTPVEKTEVSQDIPVGKMLNLNFSSPNKKPFYADVEMQETFPAKTLIPVQKGFWISQELYTLDDTDFRNPVKELEAGKSYVARIKVVTNTSHRQVMIESPIPAGAEALNFDLQNAARSLQQFEEVKDEKCWGWCWPTINHREFYYDKVRFFVPEMTSGTFEFRYILQARIAGTYEVTPVKILEMYRPETFATGQGSEITILSSQK